MSDWEFRDDPHKVIPNDFYSLRYHYKVVGFSAPAGKEVRKLMVQIRYDGGGATTLNYLTVLYDYFNSIDRDTFVSTVLYPRR